MIAGLVDSAVSPYKLCLADPESRRGAEERSLKLKEVLTWQHE